MGVHLALRILLLVWLIKISSLEAAFSEFRICDDTCGGISVRYPFGMTEGCYFNNWFKVTCNSSSGSEVPYLARINVQVLYTDPSSLTVGVNVPVFSSNCNKNRSTSVNEVIDLSGSPFIFSSTANRFFATGCDNFATIVDHNNSIIGGCLSTCTGREPTARVCYGLNCCQIPVPPDLKFLNISISNLTSQPTECRAAFLTSYLDDPYALEDEDHVPALLDWGSSIGTCCETSSSLVPACFGDLPGYRCSIPLTETFACLCNEVSYSDVTRNGICQGNLIFINSTGGNSSENRPEGYYEMDSVQLSCISRHWKFEKKSHVKLIVAGCSGGLGTLILLIGVWGLYMFVKRRKEIKLKQKFFRRNGGFLLQQQLASREGNIEKTKLFTTRDLEMATENYNANRILGQGGQGTVYKGMLSDGKIVAIKRSKLLNRNNLREFINEVVILSQINHRNVVKLLGCCLETEVPQLVYEFVPNGTLLQYIHEDIEEFPLTWEMRLRIATEVADALFYLHSAASILVYHRDIKSANILLDEKYVARGGSGTVMSTNAHNLNFC